VGWALLALELAVNHIE